MSLNPKNTTKDELRRIISDQAATIANDILDSERTVPEMERPFREAHWKGNGFCIDFDDSPLEAFEEVRRAEIYAALQVIGRRAVKQAVRQNGQLIAGLIIGE